MLVRFVGRLFVDNENGVDVELLLLLLLIIQMVVGSVAGWSTVASSLGQQCSTSDKDCHHWQLVCVF